MKSAGKARNNGLYRHIRTSKEIIRNLLNDSYNKQNIRLRVSMFWEIVSVLGIICSETEGIGSIR